MTDINRGTAQLKTWQKTESKGHSEFDGTYELFSVAETNLYANGTTDSFSKSESTDDGLTKSDSDITVTSKATDARQAPGYDIDAKVGAAPDLHWDGTHPIRQESYDFTIKWNSLDLRLAIGADQYVGGKHLDYAVRFQVQR